MSLIDARDVPADPTSMERLAKNGLDYRFVDMADSAGAERYQRAVSRVFLGDEPTADAMAFGADTLAGRRNTGVFESGSSTTDLPIATVNSWVTPLTVPGGAELPMWAISTVTVAATHRRRGIARALLEGELRAASDSGLPMAGLTVSEATIYGRYGFGSAIPVARFTVDTRRAGWVGAAPTGTIQYVERDALVADLGKVYDRMRRSRAGSIAGWKGRWEGFAGLSPSDKDRERVRGVRFLDGVGQLRGVLVYTLDEKDGSFRFAIKVRLLATETPEALAALWRFATQHDLVDEVVAELRPIDDPLPWLVADPRGVVQTVHDHGWLRILSVPEALSARRYSAPVDVVLHIDDPLGFATGNWRLATAYGCRGARCGGERLRRASRCEHGRRRAVDPLCWRLPSLHPARRGSDRWRHGDDRSPRPGLHGLLASVARHLVLTPRRLIRTTRGCADPAHPLVVPYGPSQA